MNMETVDPSTAGVHMGFSRDSAKLQPGQSLALHYLITNASGDQVLTDLPIVHERPMHLIAVSKDLTQFQHVHPTVGADGAYSVEVSFPGAGTQVLFDEFVYNEQNVLDRRELPIGKTPETGVSLSPDLSPKTEDGLTASLLAPETIKAGEDERFTRVTRPVVGGEKTRPVIGALHLRGSLIHPRDQRGYSSSCIIQMYHSCCPRSTTSYRP